jgi:RNAse (barnase) inhibitor barstar
MPNFVLSKQVSVPEAEGLVSLTIDGKKCETIEKFYKHIEKVFSFPDYFGYNLDSFDELLNDLSWIYEEAIIIEIKNFEQLLEAEDGETKEVVFSLLDQAADEHSYQAEGKAIKIMMENQTAIVDFLNEIGVEYITN